MSITLGQLDWLVNSILENETLAKHIKDGKQTLKNKLQDITEHEKARIGYLRRTGHVAILLRELHEKYDIN
jgi:hypothetical protein